MKKKTIVIVICIAVAALIAVAVILAVPRSDNRKLNYAMFSWGDTALSNDEEDDLIECMERADVSTIYPEFSDSALNFGEAEDFLIRAEQRGTQIYAVLGRADMAYDETSEELKDKMKELIELRDKSGTQSLKGFVIDVEPHSLDEWEMEKSDRRWLMETYLNAMSSAYNFAALNQFKFILCIPVYYDVVCEDILEELVSRACDGIVVMNYDRTDEYGQIRTEVELAKKIRP